MQNAKSAILHGKEMTDTIAGGVKNKYEEGRENL
jgi:hypothetical protein